MNIWTTQLCVYYIYIYIWCVKYLKTCVCAPAVMWESIKTFIFSELQWQTNAWDEITCCNCCGTRKAQWCWICMLLEAICAKSLKGVGSLQQECFACSKVPKALTAFGQYQNTIHSVGAEHYRYKSQNIYEGYCQRSPGVCGHNSQSGAWGHLVHIIRDEEKAVHISTHITVAPSKMITEQVKTYRRT